MQAIRSLQRRQDGIELWAVIHSETERSFVVHGPEALPTDACFPDIRGAKAEFDQRLSLYGHRHEHWYGRVSYSATA